MKADTDSVTVDEIQDVYFAFRDSLFVDASNQLNTLWMHSPAYSDFFLLLMF